MNEELVSHGAHGGHGEERRGEGETRRHGDFPCSRVELHPGDMVMADGVECMVLRVLPDGLVRIRKWPILEAPPARDVPRESVEFVERPGAPLASFRNPQSAIRNRENE